MEPFLAWAGKVIISTLLPIAPMVVALGVSLGVLGVSSAYFLKSASQNLGGIRDWIVRNSDAIKNASDTAGWISLGLAAAAIIGVPFTGGASLLLLYPAFAIGAASGVADLAVGSARQSAGVADLDDHARLVLAPLAFVPGGKGVNQIGKKIAKEVGPEFVYNTVKRDGVVTRVMEGHYDPISKTGIGVAKGFGKHGKEFEQTFGRKMTKLDVANVATRTIKKGKIEYAGLDNLERPKIEYSYLFKGAKGPVKVRATVNPQKEVLINAFPSTKVKFVPKKISFWR